ATSSWDTVKKKMTENQGAALTIVRVQGGTWTRNSGHFMVIRGFDENGKVYVADPASTTKSQKVHDETAVKNFAAQYWVITGPIFAFAGGGGDGTYAWPVPGHSRISSKYGMRRHPTTGVYKLHDGIDIPAPSGTPIIASVGGTVDRAAMQGAWGNCVTVKSGNGIMCRYAHMSRMAVKAGQVVNQGTVLGYVGTTGASTGNHLHFGIYINGSPVNPQSYIGKDSGLGTGGSAGGGTGGTGGTLSGTYKATFYCPGSCCNGKWAGVTASGKKPTPGRTIAVDPKKIKLGTKIRLEFLDGRLSKYNGSYYAEDTGGDIKGLRIDVLTKTHAECNVAGVGQVKIYIMK
ncbi:MAG: peptidoglycan DD-metalloendopeptidase family protein, partial [Oscillospiraceae bacterium]